MKLLKNLYLPNRFFLLFSAIVVLYCFGFAFQPVFYAANALLFTGMAFVLADVVLLFNKKVTVSASRKTPRLMSLGDENTIELQVYNDSPLSLNARIIEELPPQLQERDFSLYKRLPAREELRLRYVITPKTRGSYPFGSIHVYTHSFLGLVTRRFRTRTHVEVPVFPSVIQLKKYEFKAFSRSSSDDGIKKIRRIGHSYEFEQIKNYVRGDDVRSINWKATGRKAELMVNHYEDEKSQSIYCVIDKSRAMRMPFNGLTLTDHAINASLVLANIGLLKQDKAGLITFSDKIGSTIKARRGKGQLRTIMNALYKEEDRQLDANYELLYYAVNKIIPNRSLLLLYTNFESLHSMQRTLPILRRLNRQHLLVVTIFINTEIETVSQEPCETMEEIYQQTVAKKFVEEKHVIVRELKKYGIHAILTRPEELTVNSINKYLELKSRGMI